MPQIDFTVFFVFTLWIFPVFFAGFFYSLVYLYPAFVLWNKVLLCLADLALLKTFIFIKFRSFSHNKYLFQLS